MAERRERRHGQSLEFVICRQALASKAGRNRIYGNDRLPYTDATPLHATRRGR